MTRNYGNFNKYIYLSFRKGLQRGNKASYDTCPLGVITLLVSIPDAKTTDLVTYLVFPNLYNSHYSQCD